MNGICAICGKACTRVSATRLAKGYGQLCREHSPTNHRVGPLICLTCGATFDKQGHAHQRFCSRACLREHQRANHVEPPPREPKIVECMQCGGRFIRRGNGWTCSTACRQKQVQQAYRDRYERWYQPRKLEPAICSKCGQAYQSRHRARLLCRQCRRRGDITGGLRRQIGERDGWRCYLCGKRVIPSYATLDHLVPYSQGGTEAPGNLRIVHRSCNSRRGAGRTPAQLVLI